MFAAERDFEYYVETLSEYRSIYGVQVYAWCLMTNHIHLIIEPPEEVARLGHLMKRLAGRQTRFVNRLEGRRSRYKDYIKTVIPVSEWDFIQETVERGQLTGNGLYIEEVERIIGRRIEPRRLGRPKKNNQGQK